MGDGIAGETVTKLTHDEIRILRRYCLETKICIYVRGLAKMFWPNTSGYIAGTYIISD